MKIVYSRRALAQLDAIFAFIGKDNPAAAAAVVNRVETCAGRLGEYPYLGRVTEKENVRVFVVAPYPYLLFYMVVPHQIEVRILSVRHGARQP